MNDEPPKKNISISDSLDFIKEENLKSDLSSLNELTDNIEEEVKMGYDDIASGEAFTQRSDW